MADRALPSAVMEEGLVVGSMLHPDGGADLVERIRHIVSPEDFTRETYSRIYRSAISVVENGEPADLLTVTRDLERTGNLEKIGGVSCLDKLIESVPTVSTVEHHAKEVKRASWLRRFINVTERLSKKAYDAFQLGVAPAELLAELEKTISQDGFASGGLDMGPSVADELEAYTAHVKDRWETGPLGLLTGFSKLDEITDGLEGLIVVGGTPGAGKTSFALQVTTEIARLNPDAVCLFYELEMARYALITRILSRLSRVDAKSIKLGSVITERERHPGLIGSEFEDYEQAKSEFGEYANRVFIRDYAACPDMSIGVIRGHIAQAKRRFSTHRIFVCVDHLQIFPTQEHRDDLKLKLDALVDEFRKICDQTESTVMLVSEKNRQSKDKAILQGYMGTAGIEYSADLALMLKEEKEDTDPMQRLDENDDERKVSVNALKNRDGRRGKMEMIFVPKLFKFTER